MAEIERFTCQVCGHRWWAAADSPQSCERCTPAAPRPPLTRDALLAEIARSLRATRPERAEELFAEIEFRLVGRCTKCRARIVGTEERLCTACDPALNPMRCEGCERYSCDGQCMFGDG